MLSLQMSNFASYSSHGVGSPLTHYAMPMTAACQSWFSARSRAVRCRNLSDWSRTRRLEWLQSIHGKWPSGKLNWETSNTQASHRLVGFCHGWTITLIDIPRRAPGPAIQLVLTAAAKSVHNVRK